MSCFVLASSDLAGKLRPSLRVTRIERAPSTTWLLVTTLPSGLTRTPLPWPGTSCS